MALLSTIDKLRKRRGGLYHVGNFQIELIRVFVSFSVISSGDELAPFKPSPDLLTGVVGVPFIGNLRGRTHYL